MKLRSFCIAKETISKVKRQPSEWEKIIANEATDEEGFLISLCYSLELCMQMDTCPLHKIRYLILS